MKYDLKLTIILGSLFLVFFLLGFACALLYEITEGICFLVISMISSVMSGTIFAACIVCAIDI